MTSHGTFVVHPIDLTGTVDTSIVRFGPAPLEQCRQWVADNGSTEDFAVGYRIVEIDR